MKKNPLFYQRTNANKTKIALAKRKLILSLACIFSIVFITTLSIDNTASAKGVVKTASISMGSLALLPFAAGVRGTKDANGEDETEDAFKARKGAAESPEAYTKRLMLHIIDDRMKTADKTFTDKLNELKEQVTAAKASSDLITALKEEMKKHGLDIEALKESGTGKGKVIPLNAQVAKFIEDNADKIKKLREAGSGVIEFKAVGSMLTSSAAVPDGIPALQGVQVAPPTNVNLRSTLVNELVSLFPTSLASYAYTESVPKDGDYSFIAEAGTKPEIDFKIETRYAAPKKVAAYILLSEESVTDIPGLQAIAVDYLRKKHDLKRQNGILFGDGTGNNLKGATTYGRSFSADGLANKVVSPNFMDVVNAAITDIFTTHNYTDEMPYMANLVMVNPVDFFTELVAAKDGFGRPLYPTASLFNKVTIGGATIVPFEDIPSGKIFVADMSKYNLTDYIGYTIRIGWINDNFITNQFVMVGESRLHGFVKNLDQQAFLYDDIAVIKAAIQAA